MHPGVHRRVRAEHGGGERTPRAKGAASKGVQECMVAERRQRNGGFEEETEEKGRAVTGYGIPA